MVVRSGEVLIPGPSETSATVVGPWPDLSIAQQPMDHGQRERTGVRHILRLWPKPHVSANSGGSWMRVDALHGCKWASGFSRSRAGSGSAPRRLIIQTGPPWLLALADNRGPLAGGWLTASGVAQCFHFGLDEFSRAEDGTRRSGPLAAPSAVNAYESPRALPSRPLPPLGAATNTKPLPYGSRPRTASTRPPPFHLPRPTPPQPSHPIPSRPSLSPPFP